MKVESKVPSIETMREHLIAWQLEANELTEPPFQIIDRISGALMRRDPDLITHYHNVVITEFTITAALAGFGPMVAQFKTNMT
jgi:hypothetical protein